MADLNPVHLDLFQLNAIFVFWKIIILFKAVYISQYSHLQSSAQSQ